ncbi:MAG: type IV toxin-antitoxin system AbiEi family antitoxin [Solirubrobacteraceae bacterium]
MKAPDVSGADTLGDRLTRAIPPSLSPILTELELESARVVTITELTALVQRAGIHTEPRVVADRLRRLGWLLPTATAGVWEFAPGSHAGPVGHGDQYLELRAALAARPTLNASVCLLSALAAQGLSDRAPDRLEVAVPRSREVPDGLRRGARVVIFAANLTPVRSQGVPIHQPSTILVHVAARPADVSGWGAVADALPDLVDTISIADLDAELAGRARSVRARLAYLVHGVSPQLADHLLPPQEGGRSSAKVWFGPRASLRRHNSRFAVADTLLPFDPGTLVPNQ